MSDLIANDGTVIPSSQRSYADHDNTHRRIHPMVGIILAVHPSDADENWTADNHPLLRGSRHECTVWAADDLDVPSRLIHNVVIPPQRPSGVDNFEEDLPRGCSKLVDGTTYKTDFSDVDPAKLDGEWCIVNFIGGKLEYPYVANWWPHPYNNIDPATSGNTPPDQSLANLTQADLKKNRSRTIRTKNGTVITINRDGSVYLDTQEAGRTVKLDDTKRTVSNVDKGGHVQVDVKKKAQLEFNWNDKATKGPRHGAGGSANSPVHDPDLPHDDQPFKETKPSKRETKRTWMRFEEYKAVVKSSDVQITAKTEGSEDGQMTLFGTKTVALMQQESGAQAARVQIEDGSITIQGKDGTVITVSQDQIALVTKSGGQISVIGDKMMLTGPGGVGMSVPVVCGTGAFGVMMGEPWATANGLLNTAWDKFVAAVGAYIDGVKQVAEISGASAGYPLSTAAKQAADALAQAISTFNGSSATWTSKQVKVQ